MAKLSFRELDQVIGNILPGVSGARIAAIKSRIATEVETLEADPAEYSQKIDMRTRIRDAEHKYFLSLAKRTPLIKSGYQCSLCGSFSSDVEIFVALGDCYHICDYCVGLINNVVSETEDKL